MPILVPKCDKCSTEMLLKDKNGEKFWGCPNWQRCKGKTKPYGGVDKSFPNAPQTPTPHETKADGNILVMESLNEIIRLLNDISDRLKSEKDIHPPSDMIQCLKCAKWRRGVDKNGMIICECQKPTKSYTNEDFVSDFQKIGELLPKSEEISIVEDEINVKDIPF